MTVGHTDTVGHPSSDDIEAIVLTGLKEVPEVADHNSLSDRRLRAGSETIIDAGRR